VRRVVVALAIAFAAASALTGATSAGSYVPPPGDGVPVWSPDGSRIAFFTSRAGQGLAMVSAAGGSDVRLVEHAAPYNAAISPDWQWVATSLYRDGRYRLTVARLDGTGERLLATTEFGTRPAWSPDSKRIAFRAADESLAVIGIDGGAATPFASGGGWLAWSPDGTRIAFGGGGPDDVDVYVADPATDQLRLIAGGPGEQLEPKWSPDGTRIAFLTQDEPGESMRIGVARPDGTGLATYPGPGVSNSDSFAWLPSSQAIVFARHFSEGLYRLDLDTGAVVRLTGFGANPAPSPDGQVIAFAAGGECRDRYGVYVARSDGRRMRRLTNDCRVLGTPRDDTLRGTGLADVLLGLAGEDRLTGLSAGYVGDTLRGGDGGDVLVGTISGDVLRGGDGADRLFGGLSADVLYGEAGQDRIDAQAGRDLVHARDGARDLVRCGTNRGGTPERDEVWADRVDVVSSDCEIVHRRGRR
jgi:Tol biopolymer transport system component